MSGIDEPTESIMNCVSPPSTPLSAGALPLYGTCSICVPVSSCSSSPARCSVLPMPVLAKLASPGLALAAAIRSASVRAGLSVRTTSTSGVSAMRATGVKSRAGS